MSPVGCRSRVRFVAAVFALAVPSIALAVDGIICLPVPPGGSIQLKVRIHDPTPIIIDLQSFGVGADLGAVQQVTLSGAPDAAGTAAIVSMCRLVPRGSGFHEGEPASAFCRSATNSAHVG